MGILKLLSYLQKDLYRDVQAQKFLNILEKMQEDVLNEQETVPFLLCGKLLDLQNSQLLKSFVYTYFQNENNSIPTRTFLLEHLPALPGKILTPEYTVSTNSADITGKYVGSISLIKKENLYSMDDALKNVLNDNTYTILCGGKAGVSGGRDSDGNESVQGGVTFSGQSDGGIEYSAGASVEVKRDSDGNVTTEARFSGTIEW